ncbi:MAG: ribosome maturation factor RimM [FCB group bacterium]|jgi:16S rRNA processing protein RimM
MEYEQIGIITGTRGYKGELLLKDVPSGLNKIPKGMTVLVGFSAAFAREFILIKWESEGKNVIISLKEITSKEDAHKLKEQGVFAESSNINYAKNEDYFVNDIIGCSVYDTVEKKEIGIIKDVLLMKANDIWVVDSPGGEILLPYIDDVIKKVDLKKKRIDIVLIPGLLELNKTKTESK